MRFFGFVVDRLHLLQDGNDGSPGLSPCFQRMGHDHASGHFHTALILRLVSAAAEQIETQTNTVENTLAFIVRASQGGKAYQPNKTRPKCVLEEVSGWRFAFSI
jgi:hypothetical protein